MRVLQPTGNSVHCFGLDVRLTRPGTALNDQTFPDDSAVEEGRVSKYTNLHKVRHWFGTQLAGDPNTDLQSVKQVMGHHSASFTIDTYAHGDRDRAGRASERVGGQLWGD